MKIFIKKYLKYILAGSLLLFLLVLVIISAIGSSKTVNNSADYKQISDVEGVAFLVNNQFIDNATAIMEISDGIDLISDTFYVYKNGTDEFMLFQISGLVIAVQKDTDFHLEDNDENVTSSNILNIWFEKSYKKAKVKKINDICYIPVNAGVSFTTDIYGDFTGELATISDENGTEWGIFVGIPGERFDKLEDNTQNSIHQIVSSLCLYEKPIQEEEIYAVLLGNNEESDIENNSEENNNSDEIKDDSQIDNNNNNNNQNLSNIETDISNDSIKNISEDEDTLLQEEIITDTNNINNNLEDNHIEKVEEIEEVREVKEVEDTEIEKNEIKLSNQKKYERVSNKAYTSSPYSMLQIGESGIINEVDFSTSQTESPIITIKEIITGEQAEIFLKEYCNLSSNIQYKDAPDGSSWHIAKYNIFYANCNSNPYINIKFKGLDGNKLHFKGVEYSDKTYDIFDYDKNYYVYYAVPNGCKQYCLECGTGCIDNTDYEGYMQAAYFFVDISQ